LRSKSQKIDSSGGGPSVRRARDSVWSVLDSLVRVITIGSQALAEAHKIAPARSTLSSRVGTASAGR